MKNKNKLISLLRDGLSGDDGSLKNLQTMLYEQLISAVSNLNFSQHNGQDIQVCEKMRESLGLGDLDLSVEERAHLLSKVSGQVRRVLAEINADSDQVNNAGQSLGELSADKTMLMNDEKTEVNFLMLDDFIKQLSLLDERKATLFELSYFGGMNYEEIGQVLSMPVVAVDRELRYATAWLCREITD